MNAVTHQASSQSWSPEGLASTLQSVQIEGHVDGLLLSMKIRQHYKNTRDTSVEAVYTFPLPWGATLLGLAAEIDGHRLQGTVMEKVLATQRYEQAIDEGDTPILVERAARGLYTANLGNLLPGEDAVIELAYAQLLRFEQGQIRITVPTTVGPRYGDAHTRGGLPAHASASASVLAQYPLTAKITLTGDVALAAIQCPSHAVAMARVDEALVVTLQQGGLLDRDFVLLLQGLQGQSFASVAPDGEGFAVMASFCPTAPEAPQAPARLKVLVDCSGSMAGDRMASARSALHEVLKELTDQDWISYSRFGSGVTHDLAGLQPCDAPTRQRVAHLVDGTHADLGGTEMNAALISTFGLGMAKGIKALFTPAEKPRPQNDVLLITDGDIWDVETVIQVAQQSGHRVFAIGVGSAPAESLLREVAEKSGGACELVSPNQDVAEVIVRMFRRMRSTRCTQVTVDWGQPVLWQSPLPVTIYGGDTLHLCARLAQRPAAPPKLTWHAHHVPLQASAPQLQHLAAAWLPRLVASQHIEQLARANENPAQALALALNHQLVTPQTHLILVHVRAQDQKADGLPTLDKVSPMLAAGWGGVGRVADLHSRVDLGRPALDRSVLMSGVGHVLYNQIGSTPSVWRIKDRASAQVDASLISAGDDFDLPAFLRSTPRQLAQGPMATPLDLLQTLEATAVNAQAAQHLVDDLQALNLPAGLVCLLDTLTAVLGTQAKAWALVLQWLSERLQGQITLSRHSERLLRQALKDENAQGLQSLKLTWAVEIDAFMNPALAPAG